MEGHLLGEFIAIAILFKHTQKVNPPASFAIAGVVVLGVGVLTFFFLKKKKETPHKREFKEKKFFDKVT